MIGATSRQPTETELEAHIRRAAFRQSIADKAAALKEKKSCASEPRPAPVAVPEFLPLLPPMKEPWFSIESVSVVKTLKVREIQMLVCDRYGLTLTELLAERRFRPLVRTRQVAMYLCKVLTGRSLPEIGRRFGGKDHTTVLHAARKVTALIDADSPEFDPVIAAAVKALRADLEARLD
jgi:hypothetical protein